MYSRPPEFSLGRSATQGAHPQMPSGHEHLPHPMMMPPGAGMGLLPPPIETSSILGPREKEFLFSDPTVQAEARKLLLKQLVEEAKQAELKTALLAAQVKQSEIQNAQMEAELTVAKSGLPQELLKLQMEAAAVQAKKMQTHMDDQSKIAELTAGRMTEDEEQKKKTDDEFKKNIQHTMFR